MDVWLHTVVQALLGLYNTPNWLAAFGSESMQVDFRLAFLKTKPIQNVF